MIRPITGLAVLLSVFSGACQVVPDGAGGAAVEVSARVFASDRGEDVKELWAVDARSGKKLEPLLEGSSRDYRINFAPTKEWMAIEDVVLDTFTTVRLFHHESLGGYRRVPDEEYILGPWREFLRRHALAEGEVAASASTVDSWTADGKGLRLSLSATKPDGTVVQDRILVDLAGLE